MSSNPLPLNLMVVLLLGLITWGILRAPSPEDSDGLMGIRDDLPWGLCVLAGLAIIVFISFLLLGARS